MSGQWQGGKGSKRRPENRQAIDDNWDKIFRKKMKVIIYGKDNCPYCDMADRLATQVTHETPTITYNKYMLDEDFNRETLMETFPGARTFPQIIVDGEKIGGFTEFKALVDASK